ncbi:MAG: hypothetical protein R6U32_00810 [Candidatus Woesearchaeota archaeon]
MARKEHACVNHAGLSADSENGHGNGPGNGSGTSVGQLSLKGKALGLLIICLFVWAVLPAASHAQSYTDFYITVKEIETDDPVRSMPVKLHWEKMETGGTVNLTKYIDERGTFNYRITPGEWKLKVFVDNTSTPETNYIGESVYSIPDDVVSKAEMYVTPVGTLKVKVLDQSGNLVQNADVGLKCRSFSKNARTDMFGSYRISNIPVGECTVSAASSQLIGSTEASVEQGVVNEVNVNLSENVTGSGGVSKYYLLLPIAVVIIFILSYLIIRKKMRHHIREEVARKIKGRKAKVSGGKKQAQQKKGQKQGTQKQDDSRAKTSTDQQDSRETEGRGESGGKQEELNPRARDIIKTLNAREKEVVDFLLAHNMKSTQAAIRNDTGIPKTSLARIFQSLESKNVIKVETIGKLKKIEITDWFLGKD